VREEQRGTYIMEIESCGKSVLELHLLALNIKVVVNKMGASPPTESEIPSVSTPDLQRKTGPGTIVVIKSYDKRGMWSIHRLASATGFLCSRCQKE
jgi:hypothetical protein